MLRRVFFKNLTFSILLFVHYKIHIFSIFLQKNLHMSKKSSTFAPDFKKNIINN